MPSHMSHQNEIRPVANGHYTKTMPQHRAGDWSPPGMRGVRGRVGDAARRGTRWSGLILVLLIVGFVCASPVLADGQGCRPDVEGKIGAQVTAQVLRPSQDGRLGAVGPSGTEVDARARDRVR